MARIELLFAASVATFSLKNRKERIRNKRFPFEPLILHHDSPPPGPCI